MLWVCSAMANSLAEDFFFVLTKFGRFLQKSNFKNELQIKLHIAMMKLLPTFRRFVKMSFQKTKFSRIFKDTQLDFLYIYF